MLYFFTIRSPNHTLQYMSFVEFVWNNRLSALQINFEFRTGLQKNDQLITVPIDRVQWCIIATDGLIRPLLVFADWSSNLSTDTQLINSTQMIFHQSSEWHYRKAFRKPSQLLCPEVHAQLVQLLLDVSWHFTTEQRWWARNHCFVCKHPQPAGLNHV